METVYDWITLGLFSALVILFLQRALATEERGDDPLFLYLAAGIGCAAANYLGNHGQHLLAVIAIVGTMAFSVYFLKPFAGWPRR